MGFVPPYFVQSFNDSITLFDFCFILKNVLCAASMAIHTIDFFF